MGRNHRHKKDLRAEKAKVKLKQSKTKFLPKGLNVTNTAFKIKPIVLPEQLKQKSSDDILSKRKLNVKDLLSRIKHYNENVRHSACEELSDMVKTYTQEIAQQHLSHVCLAVSGLTQDKERKVRKAAIKCVRTILHYVPNEKLVPFFNYFSTNLRCAMTNIDKNVQEDSLLFLDCFIEANCDLITKSSEKLLPDFLALISKLRGDSQPGRTLTLNLGSKMTSVAWRIKVLSRLHAFLKVILENEEGFIKHFTEDTFDATQYASLPIYKKQLTRVLEESFFIYTNKASSYDGSSTVTRHIVTVVPLLYETWLEVMPEQKVQKSASEPSTLTEETAALLTCIANTLYLLWRYVGNMENEEVNLKTVFLSSEGQKFFAHLLKNFPYYHSGERPKKAKSGALKTLQHNKDPKCVHENVSICFLYLALHVHCTQRNLKNDMVAINTYLTKIFLQKASLNEESVQCLLQLLSECFGESSQKWHQNGVDLRIMLENAIAFYDHGTLSRRQKLKLLQILSGVVNNAHLSRNNKYQNWLATLPNILCQRLVTDSTVSALLDLSKKNCESFHAALIKKLPAIIDNLKELTIASTSDSLLQSESAACRKLAALFYYVPEFSRQELQLLRDFVGNSQSRFAKYFREVLILRNELEI